MWNGIGRWITSEKRVIIRHRGDGGIKDRNFIGNFYESEEEGTVEDSLAFRTFCSRGFKSCTN